MVSFFLECENSDIFVCWLVCLTKKKKKNTFIVKSSEIKSKEK